MSQEGDNLASCRELYDQEYYASHCGPRPCVKEDEEWGAFYGQLAENIRRSLAPRTVFDAGCGIGFLVESLWDRGIEAHGRDISKFGIEQVRPDVRPWCSIGSITEPIDGTYDLITCIEVLEHLDENAALMAMDRMTESTTKVLFSSSPIDFTEPTHVNVRPPLYWIREFAARGFRPVLSYDARFVSPWALLFEHTTETVGEPELIAAAEIVRERVVRHKVQDEATRGLLAELESRCAKLGSLEQDLDVTKTELDRTRADLESALRSLTMQSAITENAERQAAGLRNALDEEARRGREREEDLQSHVQLLSDQLEVIQNSTLWRATYPARLFISRVPHPVRRFLHRIARPGSEPIAKGAFVPDPTSATSASRAAVGQLNLSGVKAAFPFLEPINVFRSSELLPTVNMVTDSVSPSWLYGGVATAGILSALLAERLGASLRIVTRNEPGDAARIRRVLDLNQISFNGRVDMLHLGVGDARAMPVSERDVFITTSWWTSLAVVRAIGHGRVVYLLQEDERMFYGRGDERLRCSEVLSDPLLRIVVNSELLLKHLADGTEAVRGLRERALAFEPAFPDTVFYDDPDERNKYYPKRTFLFYARPNNQRNLYWRGMESIELAITQGVLDPKRWRFLFVGKDLPTPSLPGDPDWANYENLPWEDYARLVRSAHVGMSLIDTPHPSYPPLDLAASGAAVVTNTFEAIKTDLSSYSRNIIATAPTPECLCSGIAQAIALQDDAETLTANYRASQLGRDWRKALLPTVEQVLSWVDF